MLDASGKVKTTTNVDRQIRNHVMGLVNTEPGERVIYRDYGVGLIHQLFESGDETVSVLVGELVKSALENWEPGVRLTALKSGEGIKGDGLSITEVEYSRLDAPDSGSASFRNIATIRTGGHVNEVIRG